MANGSNPSSSVPARVVQIAATLGKPLTGCTNARLQEYWPEWHRGLLTLKEQCERFEDVVISLLGGMRTGKSTLINALLGAPLLPTGGEEACTSAVTEVSFADDNSYTARIEFMSREEWQRLVDALLANGRAESGEGEAGDRSESRIGAESRAVLAAVYGQEKLRTLSDSKALPLPPAIDQAIAAGTITIRSSDLPTFREKIASYIGSGTADSQPLYWPIVRSVKIAGPFPTLRGGIRLVDLPGINDPNQAREAVTRNHLKTCRFIWFVFNMRGVIDKGLGEVITSDQFVQMVLDGRATATTFIGTNSDDFRLVEARKKFDKPQGNKADLARARNGYVRNLVQRQLHELFQQTFSGASPTAKERQQALEKSFSESRIFTVSAWDYLAGKCPELDPEEKPKLEATETEIPALLFYMQERCKEFGIQAQERQLHHQIDSHMLELKQEVSAQRLVLDQKARTEDQQQALKKATALVCEHLRTSLEGLTAAYQEDLEKSRLILGEQMKEGIDRAEDALEEILSRWNAYAANQIQAVVRAGAEGNVFYSRTLRKYLNFASDLTAPLLRAVAFAWDDFFGKRLDPTLDARGRELLETADKHGKELMAAVREIVATDAALQADLKGLVQTTQQLLADHLEQAKAQMKKEITSRRKTLHEQLPSRVSEKIQPGFTSAARQSGGDGVKRRMLGILESHARQVSGDMHQHVEQTIMEGVKKLCTWLLGQFEGMAKTVSAQLEKAASGLRPAPAAAPSAEMAHQRSCLHEIDSLVDGLLRKE